MVSEITSFVRTNLGLRNIAHADPQVVIERYASDFGKRYFEVLAELVEAFNKLVAQFMDKSFVQDGIPVVAKRVVEFLHNKACEI